MKDTYFKKKQGERQALLVEQKSFVFYGANNGGVASLMVNGTSKEMASRKVLKDEDREKNLYEPIRKEVCQYINDAHISWWHMSSESSKEVTAHILSSQVCCLNHLFQIRNDEEAIKEVLEVATGVTFDEILPSFIENNTLISFEFAYDNKHLIYENHETRGKNCTSVDALIYARKGSEKWLIPIEWKYTEAYDHKRQEYNYKRYLDLVGSESRLYSWDDLYRTDPFYELGRQTLLMEKIIEVHRDIADNFIHFLVVPYKNTEIVDDALNFRASLKKESQDKFVIVDPSKLMAPIEQKYPDLYNYLKTRYWQ